MSNSARQNLAYIEYQRDIEYLRNEWLYQAAIDAMNQGAYEDAIVHLRVLINSVGKENGRQPINGRQNLVADPAYGKQAYDESISKLAENIDGWVGKHGPASYAIPIRMIADIYGEAIGDSPSALKWHMAFLDVLELYPDLNDLNFDQIIYGK